MGTKLYSSGTTDVVQINENDRKMFKNLLIAFIILQIIAIIVYLFKPVFSALFYDAGSLAFIVGIILLSKKYRQLASGIKIAVLYILAIVSELVVAEFNNLYPHSSHISPAVESIQNQLITIQNGFGKHVFIIILFIILTGILMFLTAYFLSPWINTAFNFEYKQMKFFWYFGVFFIIGDIITAVGYFLYDRVLRGVIKGTRPVTSIAIPGLVILLGVILLLAAFVLEIIAGIKIYQNLNKVIVPVPVNQGIMFCKNCGAQLAKKAKLCHNCGLPIDS